MRLDLPSRPADRTPDRPSAVARAQLECLAWVEKGKSSPAFIGGWDRALRRAQVAFGLPEQGSLPSQPGSGRHRR